MPVRIKKKFISKLLADKPKKITDDVRKDFARRVNFFIKGVVLDSIKKGISPVNIRKAYPKNTGGKSRYQKYSKSYVEAMQGKAAYFTKNGRVIRAEIDQSDKELVKFSKELYGNKKQRPVNLKLSGKMLNSLKSKIVKNGKIRLWFSDEKAKYHDKLGAGKSKVIRRLLPDNNEEFNRAIQRKIIDTAGEAVKDLL